MVSVGLIQASAAKPIYSYVDERGSFVATDRFEDVPPRYRSRVKVATDAGSDNNLAKAGGVSPAFGGVEKMFVQLIDRLPATMIPGLNTYQSAVLIGGFGAILVFYGVGKLTRSPFLQLLMPWAVGFVALATVYFMFVSDWSDDVAARSANKSSGSLIHQFQEKGQHIDEQKQRRMKQFDQITGQQ